jgi:CRISPR-associated endonuclease/helicase Cas3
MWHYLSQFSGSFAFSESSEPTRNLTINIDVYQITARSIPLMTELYAHTPPPGSEEWHPLKNHLIAVAEQARSFADAFDASELAYWLGLWHDLGKCSEEFQTYLRLCHSEPNRKHAKVDHKAAGTQVALQHLGKLALLIQGHHGGLRELTLLENWLTDKEQKNESAINESLARARQLLPHLEPTQPMRLPEQFRHDSLSFEMFMRMLFSTLVDADFLDTERHRSPDKAELRGPTVTLQELAERLRQYQIDHPGDPAKLLNQARDTIYRDCVAAANAPHGLFRLAVPTGGGKTRSGMAFALNHAIHNGQQRVIVAVPFITITEQTVDIYRDVFRESSEERPIVLEHHSGANIPTDDEEHEPGTVVARLATENWDAPIVVTTTVQLFESLFASKTSQCRKLHRLANSVIILDEAQALPTHLLTPILDALRQLCQNYNTTVVISTATQPAFDTIPVFSKLRATEIVRDPEHWFDVLRRVEYQWRVDHPLNWGEVARIIHDEQQALAVVNTKSDAFALLDALRSINVPDVLHLSTQLCGAHRRERIAEIKQRLNEGVPCRVIATQVVEAGVDLDFPLVLRAMGPLDGIIQAAGRCNREGKPAKGRVIVFAPQDGKLPSGAYYSAAVAATNAVRFDGYNDPDNPAMARAYYRELYEFLKNKDRADIQKLRESFRYPEVAREFKMIEDETDSAIVKYGSDEQKQAVTRMIEEIRTDEGNARVLLRRLQPYIVAIPKRHIGEYQRQGLLIRIHDRRYDNLYEWLGRYDNQRGWIAEFDDDDLTRW